MLDELLATEGVVEESHLRGRVGFMALLAGLETGTYEIAVEAAGGSGASLYSVRQPWSLYWHVPSTRFDPTQSPALTSFLTHIGVALSIHGFGRPGLEEALLLGGSNRSLAGRLASALQARGFDAIDDLERIPKALRGMHRRNPVNLPEHGGVQIEIGPKLRDDDRVMDEVAAVMASVADAEMRSVCGRPEHDASCQADQHGR